MVVEIKQPKINKYKATYLLGIRGTTNARLSMDVHACATFHGYPRMHN